MYFAPPLSIASHKVVVWMGDLNFRVKGTYKDVVGAIGRGKVNALWRKDELLLAMADGRIFRGFDEGLLEFAPSYKFDENSTAYDTSQKMRVPSWTDRVLWRGNRMRLLDYACIHDVLVSDHRPVRAVLALVALKDAAASSPAAADWQNYELEPQRGVVDAIASNPLIRYALSLSSPLLRDPHTFLSFLRTGACVAALDLGRDATGGGAGSLNTSAARWGPRPAPPPKH